ncbi:MAG: HEAT repeat domain-containing protein [Proteiniphilum sp.]|uniref:HEAT repeat domain-containing protein n=1 Tax=Proteiniphilum sp. TaxID=1926877 RepID=UPI002B1FF978|nr:HEAT repeat domain-containing protein [Proteiniphilum sp.]MEA5129261.1 HEAT repeat domain-containing protein [Proteiniphilum sp.]
MRYRLLVVLLALFTAALQAKNGVNGFAIVIDSVSYRQAENEVKQYAASIEGDGLKTYIVIDRWFHPDSIKAELKRLHHAKKNPIEGAVLIGDIPIVMVRDAQHLTSAFKMNQKRDWQQSSVASDRFYDDFGLSFDFLRQDSLKPTFFYYSLRADSEQVIRSDIYTARIKPLEKGKKDKYSQLRDYLTKVVDVKTKEKDNIIDNLTVARGHGYNSESKVAWSGEQLALKEQFPTLFRPGSFVKFMDFDSYWPIKPYWMNEVLRPDLDIMLFHHHGSNDIQIVSGYKNGSDVNTSIDNIKIYLRSKISSAVKRGKDREETIEYYRNLLDVPREWCEEAFDPALLEKDSIMNLSLEISVDDILHISPNARFVMFDACFNGSFYEDEYVAGAYLFNDGKTVVTQANTVNTIQDKWPDKYLGLLNHGLRIGQWGKYAHFLETHILGDPTFRFAKNSSIDFDINDAVTTHRNDNRFWRKALDSPSVDIQAMALEMLYDNDDPGISDLLKKTYFESPDMIVRLQSLMLLSRLDNDDFVEVLIAAATDSYELTKRYAFDFIAKNGSEALLPAVARAILNDNTSKRISFKISSGFRMLDLDKLEAELWQQSESLPLYSRERLDNTLDNIRSSNQSKKKEIPSISDKSLSVNKRAMEISRFRNHPASGDVDILLSVLADPTDDTELRKAVAEALGWFNYSYRKEYITDQLRQLVATESDDIVLSEIHKTINRLSGK